MNENPIERDVDLAKVLVIRHDRNGAQAPLVDAVKIPAEYVNRDCAGGSAVQYLEDVVREYAAEHPDERDVWTWNDLFTLPDDFLTAKNVVIEPVETMVTMEVGMDEEIETPD